MKKTIFFFIAILIITAAAGCSLLSPTSQADPGVLRVMTHDSFAISAELLAAFEAEHQVMVEIILSGDTGTALNRAILSKDNPVADVIYGFDNAFLSRALDEDILEPYDSPVLSEIPADFRLDPSHAALPVDFGDVCLNYDQSFFEERSLTPPQNLEDLLKPEYRSLLVVQNPATSSPGLAFLLATIGHFGEDGYLDYWKGLVTNNVLVVNDWETAYYTEFSQWGGTRPIVVSYGSSPAFEMIYADPPVEEPPTGVVTADGSCYRQVEFVGILKNAANRAVAEKWVDFMLSVPFQEDIPMQMFVFPVNRNAGLDPTFVQYLAKPAKPAYVLPASIAAHREEWLRDWTQTVLRTSP